MTLSAIWKRLLQAVQLEACSSFKEASDLLRHQTRELCKLSTTAADRLSG